MLIHGEPDGISRLTSWRDQLSSCLRRQHGDLLPNSSHRAKTSNLDRRLAWPCNNRTRRLLRLRWGRQVSINLVKASDEYKKVPDPANEQRQADNEGICTPCKLIKLVWAYSCPCVYAKLFLWLYSVLLGDPATYKHEPIKASSSSKRTIRVIKRAIHTASIYSDIMTHRLLYSTRC